MAQMKISEGYNEPASFAVGERRKRRFSAGARE